MKSVLLAVGVATLAIMLFAPVVGAQVTDELSITYWTPGLETYRVQLVFDHQTNMVRLQVVFYDGVTDPEVAHTRLYLKKEVVRLVSSDEPVPLGMTGYTFFFDEGYPVWKPYNVVAIGDYTAVCLGFAPVSIVVNRVIRAWGTNEKMGLYPYPEIPRIEKE